MFDRVLVRIVAITPFNCTQNRAHGPGHRVTRTDKGGSQIAVLKGSSCLCRSELFVAGLDATAEALAAGGAADPMIPQLWS